MAASSLSDHLLDALQDNMRYMFHHGPCMHAYSISLDPEAAKTVDAATRLVLRIPVYD